MSRAIILLTVAAMLPTVTPASAIAQYRDAPPMAPAYRNGQPDVLARPLPAPDPAALASSAFRSRYRQAGSPRLMVMWNKAFTDEIDSAYKTHLHVEDDKTAGSTTTQGVARTWYGAYGREDVNQRSHETVDATDGIERVTADRASVLDEGTDWEIESSFADALTSNGVRLIDRTAAMRTTAMAHDLGEHPNVQAVEAKAATQKSDLIVEVLQTSAWNSPAGVLFKISVKDIRNARTLATFISTGRPPAQHMPFVAGPGGYVRATPPVASPHAIGLQLAHDVMATLSERM